MVWASVGYCRTDLRAEDIHVIHFCGDNPLVFEGLPVNNLFQILHLEMAYK